ncbi:hypothetical protein GCM10023149_44230 [Mucilaginibacter gynuensis]|uniref:Uncharacterized protein n=1 Tax=Mucilaginibacter gynuensis TaxID=1302236 RepID=A0ABP8H8M7_9SPHI
MKKLLLYAVLALLPFLTSAQSEPPVNKDFADDTKGIADSFSWDDHISVMQINLNNEKFDLVAIDDKMNILWKTTLNGYAISCGKFKGKILAIAAEKHGEIRGFNGVYKGFLIDPKTGKSEIEKTIYEGKGEYYETIANYYTGDGTYFRMVIRQSNMKRAMFSFSRTKTNYDKTTDLTVFELNERLDIASTFKPVIGDGTIIETAGNYDADLFVSVFKGDNTIEVTRYNAGAKVPSGVLSQDIDLPSNADKSMPGRYIKTIASEADRNVVYFSIMHKNYEKDIQLAVAKLDFAKKTKQIISEVFDRNHIKEIKKAFVKPNKDVDKPEFGSFNNVEVRYIRELNNTLLVAVSNKHFEQGQLGAWGVEQSIIINGYDTNLKQKFQQVMPTQCSYTMIVVPTGYYADKNTLHVIANDKDGMTSIRAIHGTLDMQTGEWKSMEILSKKNLRSSSFSDGSNALWYKNGFILPYVAMGGMFSITSDIRLQQNLF